MAFFVRVDSALRHSVRTGQVNTGDLQATTRIGRVVGQFQFPQSRFGLRDVASLVAVAQDKPTSEQLRRGADRLRAAAAAELTKHSATLMAKSAELEKQIARLKHDNHTHSRKP